MSEEDKDVDESWKDRAKNLGGMDDDQEAPKLHIKEPFKKEEDAPAESKEHSCGDPECNHDHGQDVQVDFLNYITSLGFQTLIFLGEVPNPVTNEQQKNLDQAKFLIDTLSMLKEKTAGNLNDQEKNLLDASVYELQLKYVDILQKEEKGQ